MIFIAQDTQPMQNTFSEVHVVYSPKYKAFAEPKPNLSIFKRVAIIKNVL